MEKYTYRVGDIKRIVMESSQEFNPVLGPNVKRDNKKNNDKSYKDSEKRAKDYDGGLGDVKKGKLSKKVDLNATMLDLIPDNEVSDEAKKRIAAQARGYTSELEEKNGNERGGIDPNSTDFLEYIKDASNERRDIKKTLAKSGLKARMYPDKVFDKLDNKLVKEAATKPKKLKFKHTVFMNEAQVISRIPDEYKRDGQVITMADSKGNEYIVECSLSKNTGIVETNIVGMRNKELMNEQVNRMFEIMDYKTPTSSLNYLQKENVEKDFENLFKKTNDIQ